MLKKVLLNPENVVDLVCPQCQKLWRKDLTNLVGYQRKIIFNCRCSCGHSFPVFLERRRHPRKNIDLGGAFLHDKRKTRGIIRLKNISFGGVGFELTGDYVIATGDIVLLRFNLDDSFSTLVSKETLIKLIRERYVGSQFLGDIWKHDLLHLYLSQP